MNKKLSFLLLGLGVLILIVVFLPLLAQELRFHITPPPSPEQIILPSSSQEAEKFNKQPEILEQKVVITPDNFEFSLVIPKIGLNTRVFPNIDSGNPDIYLPILKKGVAHALHSSLPNQSGPVFIFAHSTDNFFNLTRYNAVFFLLSKLDQGDSIYLFYNNQQYHYQVTHQQVVSPEDIPDLVSSIKDNTLILQTCYPPGTTLKRLLLFANPN